MDLVISPFPKGCAPCKFYVSKKEGRREPSPVQNAVLSSMRPGFWYEPQSSREYRSCYALVDKGHLIWAHRDVSVEAALLRVILSGSDSGPYSMFRVREVAAPSSQGGQ